MERVALFGGTFDPPHLGHLIIAECAREALSLDRVEFLVAADPPHKAGVARSSFVDRSAMVELAITGAPSFSVNVSETSRTGPSFTVDTLRLRHQDRPEEQRWFLIGADSLVDLPTWREPEAILSLTRLAVAARPGSVLSVDRAERELPGLTGVTDVVATPLIDISSRDIRRRIEQGRSVRFRVPDLVLAYIQDRKLYRDPASSHPRPSS